MSFQAAPAIRRRDQMGAADTGDVAGMIRWIECEHQASRARADRIVAGIAAGTGYPDAASW